MIESRSDERSSEKKSQRIGFSKKRFIFIIAFCLILGFCGFLNYSQRQVVLAQTKEIDALKQNLEAVQNDVLHTQSQWIEFKKIIMQTVASAQLTDQADREFVQTAYLVQMAYYYVEVMHQPTIAIKLLNFAMDKSSEISGPKAFQLKQTLTNSLAQLKAVPVVDLEKILQEMNAMNALIDTLVLKPEKIDIDKPVLKINPLAQGEGEGWQVHLASAFEKLSELVVIRRQAATAPELLAPNNQAYLLQHLHLFIQQAQWAALNRENKIYQTSLQEAKALILKYFINQTALTNSLVQTIDQLLAIHVAPPLPDLSHLLSALEAYQDNQTQKSAAIMNIPSQKESSQ
jgi:uroporphyrin-III C-methyltransferase